MEWHTRRLTAYDLETTGTDPEHARIVQYALAHLGGGQAPEQTERIVDPGVEVPDQAAAIHGITTARARAEGQESTQAVTDLVVAIGAALADGNIIVGHNIVYDLTCLDRECRRHLGEPLKAALGRPLAPVVDTLVLSKHVDPYRRRVSAEQGAHVLKTCVQTLLPERWGIRWDDEAAHGALYDCLMSARVAVAIAQAHPDIATLHPADLHTAQQEWKREQAASFQAYLRSEKAGPTRDPDAVIRGEWPLIPADH